MVLNTRQGAPRKPYKGMAMEGSIARWYTRNTKNGRGFHETARAISERLKPGSTVLEVAPGPGYLAIELARLGSYQITGLDISHTFVQIASENARQAGVTIDFRHGDVAHMPLPDNTFDFMVCTAAFKNFTDPVAALDEIHRVLRPGGQASIVDLRKEASLDEINADIRKMQLSPLNALFTRWAFRLMLLRNAYTRESLEGIVTRSRFRQGEIIVSGIGFDLRLSKEISLAK
ncbi:MAG TPA: class I SAM-dependent methyltransferase [Ktedonobacteraceae bacterium]|nr:class I SAM-dependent methyltransferase [Ktedonobacteraceae bacterium]